jgi:hypothetical protein
MAAGKRQQLGNKVVEPRGVLWQQHRAALEQVDLRNEALRLVPFGFVIDDVDVFFAGPGSDQPDLVRTRYFPASQFAKCSLGVAAVGAPCSSLISN